MLNAPSLNLIGHGPIDYVVVLAMVGLAFWYGLTNPIKILWLLPAATSFYFFIKVVTFLTPIKLVPFFFLLGVLIRGEKGYFNVKHSYWHWWLFLLIGVATLIGIFYTPTFDLPRPSAHLKTRLLIQFTSYVNLVFVYLIVRKECTRPGGFEILLKSYIYTSTFLCLYGVYQWIASQYGLPMRGIVYTDQKTSAALDFNNFIFRINSFANEPKRLSYVLMASVILMNCLKSDFRRFFRKKWVFYAVIALHLFCTFLTYSTSLYLSLAIYLGLILFMSTGRRFHRHYVKYTALLLLSGTMIAIFSPTIRDRVVLLYELRVNGQLEALEYEDRVRIEKHAFEYILLYPHKMILGVGPGNFNFALNEEFGPHVGITGSYLVSMNSAILILLFDFGIFGMLLIWMPLIPYCFDEPVIAQWRPGSRLCKSCYFYFVPRSPSTDSQTIFS